MPADTADILRGGAVILVFIITLGICGSLPAAEPEPMPEKLSVQELSHVEKKVLTDPETGETVAIKFKDTEGNSGWIYWQKKWDTVKGFIVDIRKAEVPSELPMAPEPEETSITTSGDGADEVKNF